MKVSQNSLGAYHGDCDLKDYMVLSAKAHQAADRYSQGHYSNYEEGASFKGCSIGCSIESTNKRSGNIKDFNDTDGFADYLNLTHFVVELQEHFFERLDVEDASEWTPLFLEAINVGSDLSSVRPKFLKFVLESVLVYVEDVKFKQQKDAVLSSLKVIEAWIETGSVDDALIVTETASDAAEDATFSAEYTAYDASCAACAAYDSATAAENTTATAAATAAVQEAAFNSAAISMPARVKEQSVELLRLLAECK